MKWMLFARMLLKIDFPLVIKQTRKENSADKSGGWFIDTNCKEKFHKWLNKIYWRGQGLEHFDKNIGGDVDDCPDRHKLSIIDCQIIKGIFPIDVS